MGRRLISEDGELCRLDNDDAEGSLLGDHNDDECALLARDYNVAFELNAIRQSYNNALRARQQANAEATDQSSCGLSVSGVQTRRLASAEATGNRKKIRSSRDRPNTEKTDEKTEDEALENIASNYHTLQKIILETKQSPPSSDVQYDSAIQNALSKCAQTLARLHRLQRWRPYRQDAFHADADADHWTSPTHSPGGEFVLHASDFCYTIAFACLRWDLASQVRPYVECMVRNAEALQRNSKERSG
ncbi:hypothetical protein FN846DRAFT_348120 [Sphaerosporella brunnea]|uniref:Uncharacterized protein n=1 Tax=Sphaerosporella brunnea TaxID=1250544 RepID=A0A5J5EHP0_9PEZI|nr:hypothetical protein FN846DRAFT_348120 [Sphaerosporella brunnea]